MHVFASHYQIQPLPYIGRLNSGEIVTNMSDSMGRPLHQMMILNKCTLIKRPVFLPTNLLCLTPFHGRVCCFQHVHALMQCALKCRNKDKRKKCFGSSCIVGIIVVLVTQCLSLESGVRQIETAHCKLVFTTTFLEIWS